MDKVVGVGSLIRKCFRCDMVMEASGVPLQPRKRDWITIAYTERLH